MGSKKQPVKKQHAQAPSKVIAEPLRKTNMTFAMQKPWYRELLDFLIVPLLITTACAFIPLFRCKQGLSYFAIVPLNAVFVYAHPLSPRKIYYEKGWQKIMEYHEYILASVKRTLLFAFLSGQVPWLFSLFLTGYYRELAIFLELAIFGLATGVFFCSLVLYVEETFKLRKADQEGHKTRLANLMGWVFGSTLTFGILTFLKINVLLKLLEGRP